MLVEICITEVLGAVGGKTWTRPEEDILEVGMSLVVTFVILLCRYYYSLKETIHDVIFIKNIFDVNES